MELLGLNIVINHSCNIDCAHCFYSCAPNSKGTMEIGELKEYVKTITKDNKLVWLGLGCGGEVFLEYETMLEAAKEIKAITPVEMLVMTNAFWAVSPERARERVEPLNEVKVDTIWLSLDAFHQKYVPCERVIHAVNASLDAGISSVCVTSEYFIGVDDDNEYNRETKKLLGELREALGERAGLVKYDQYTVIPGGRSSEMFFTYMEEMKKKGASFGVPRGRCKGTTFWGKNIKSPYGIEIFHDGTVGLCPGMAMANLKEVSLKELLEHWDYKTNPIITAIAKEGPAGLIPLAENRGYSLRTDYYNECHLCYELRKHLQPYYSQFLSPKVCYGV